jgi:hypothetical protein
MFKYLIVIQCLFIASCSNFLFVPNRNLPISPDAVGITYEDINLKSSDDILLHGWKLSAVENRAGTILFFHGNGDNVSTQLPNTYWLPEQGYDVYIFDYRGYGRSEGEVNLDKIIQDMELMIAYTVQQLPEDEKLIVMGHSLGGSMSIYAVAHSDYLDSIRALITIEAFSDYHDVTQDVLSRSWLFWLLQWPLSFTVDNSYRPLDAIDMISPVPVLILHSEADDMIDIYHAYRLFDAAKEPKSLQLIVSDHNNIFSKAENRELLINYLKSLK